MVYFKPKNMAKPILDWVKIRGNEVIDVVFSDPIIMFILEMKVAKRLLEFCELYPRPDFFDRGSFDLQHFSLF